MCDIKKYSVIYSEIKNLEPEDTLELILSTNDQQEKLFYQLIGDFLLQEKQKEVIAGNLF